MEYFPTKPPDISVPRPTSSHGREKGAAVKASKAARRVALTATPLPAQIRAHGTEGRAADSSALRPITANILSIAANYGGMHLFTAYFSALHLKCNPRRFAVICVHRMLCSGGRTGKVALPSILPPHSNIRLQHNTANHSGSHLRCNLLSSTVKICIPPQSAAIDRPSAVIERNTLLSTVLPCHPSLAPFFMP